MMKPIRCFVAMLLAVVLVPAIVPARDMNPSTGRFMTMDTYEGSKEEPQSLHKYGFAHVDPVNNVDPSGNATYVTTRPLNIPGLRYAFGVAVHVYLTFDDVGIKNFSYWAALVRELNDPKNIPEGIMANVPSYMNRPSLTTFSFHPYSVLTGNGELDRMSVISTEGSYVAYNDNIDKDAFFETGLANRKYLVTNNEDEQIRLYKLAIESRNINNSAPGTSDPGHYEFPVCNCGTWVQHIVETKGNLSFPSKAINLGTGLGGPAALTGIPILMTGFGRAWNPSLNFNGGFNLLSWDF
jgi:hypothetical protein